MKTPILWKRAMALTLQGYRFAKANLENVSELKKRLTVRPQIPSVFVKPQQVPKQAVYQESEEQMQVPKHFGITEWGPYMSTTREVAPTPDKYWEFTGSLRPSQEPVVDSFLKPVPHDGVISLQTGGGKTVCALKIASVLKLPTLVLVHNTFLRDQWEERVRAFLPSARIGRIQGETLDLEDKDIVIAMLQTLALKDHPPRTFACFGLVIVDECHHIASEAFSQAVPKITSKYMLGLSATPERKDKLMHVIHWFLGPLLYKSDTGDKIDEQVRVEYFEFPGDEALNDIIQTNTGVMSTALMVNKLAASEPRTKLITEILEDVMEEEGRQMLVLSDRVDHCKTIYEMLPEPIREEACILGRDTPAAKRSEWTATKRILIATYQMCKEGFDVATLNTLLIATPRPDVDQIVGRILRVDKASRKIHPLILDIVDVPFRRQFQERLQLQKKRNYSIQKMEI